MQMKALNRTGLASSFHSALADAVRQRGNMALTLNQCGQILSQRQQHAELARQTMTAVRRLELNGFPSTNQVLGNASAAHAARVSPHMRINLLEAMTTYQSEFGDNFLMSISAGGYPTLAHYLRAVSDEYQDVRKVHEFVLEFADRYGALIGAEDQESELEGLQARMEQELAVQTRLLHRFLADAPNISGVPLLKGAGGGDNPVTTQLNGEATLAAVLNGEAIRFNGFLSTSASFSTALDFTGKTQEDALGEPECVIDLKQGGVTSEVLRREALNDLTRGNMDTNALLFYFKTQGAKGVDLAAAQEVLQPNFNNHMNEEHEILLPPGHCFQAEQIVRNKEGIVLIGTLLDGTHVPARPAPAVSASFQRSF